MKTIKFKNDYKYHGDSRYEKVYEQMQLLGIQDVTTSRQNDNGTVVWRLPILSDKKNTYLEYASFASGYVRNQGVDCHSNWQCNKRIPSDAYYPEYEWKELGNGTREQVKTGKYLKWKTKICKLIPIEIDRLEYMMKYVIKNEFIKRANYVQEGKFIPKWKHESLLCAMEAQTEGHNVKDVTVIIDGSKFKLI